MAAPMCRRWALEGDCQQMPTTNPQDIAFMRRYCRGSCHFCDGLNSYRCELPAAETCTPGENGCHECNDDGTCNFCRDRTYLHDGACRADCPDGTVGVGIGRFRRVCQAEGSASAGCATGTGHCNECSEDGSACTICRDAQYLYDGACHAACPAGRAIGRGNFRRRCEQQGVARCIAGADHCNECTEDGSACTKCRDSQYLRDDGTCHANCPSGFVPVGNGNYRRRCVATTTRCTRMQAGCKTCNVDGSACVRCRLNQSLHDGNCVPTCPDGFATAPGINPRSQFDRVCIPALSDARCYAGEHYCHRCAGYAASPSRAYGPECIMCRDSRHLYNGECLETCPAGTNSAGGGRYHRFCEPEGI